MVYRMKVAGVERDLKLCPIGENLNIGAFILFGDVELTERCAEELYKRAPEHDVMLTAESKGIPLIHAMCRLSGKNRYVLARKSVKLYMSDVIKCETKSITTGHVQTLYIDGADAEYMK
ncbi:MAG: adenine phosphoribosyltransferase, partial [Clostridia bacterium]|nr:adenine phosphoribosyltransferase [Clostridia bacterium]